MNAEEMMKDPSVITCDLQGKITHYKAAAETLFLWKPEEVEGRQSVAIFHPPDVVATLVPRLLKTAVDQGIFQEEVNLVRKDGTRFPAELTVRPMFDKGGAHIGYMGITKTHGGSKH